MTGTPRWYQFPSSPLLSVRSQPPLSPLHNDKFFELISSSSSFYFPSLVPFFLISFSCVAKTAQFQQCLFPVHHCTAEKCTYSIRATWLLSLQRDRVVQRSVLAEADSHEHPCVIGYCDSYRLVYPLVLNTVNCWHIHASSMDGILLQKFGCHLDVAAAVAYMRVSTIRLSVGYLVFRTIDIRLANRIIQASYIRFDFNKSNTHTPLLLSYSVRVQNYSIRFRIIWGCLLLA